MIALVVWLAVALAGQTARAVEGVPVDRTGERVLLVPDRVDLPVPKDTWFAGFHPSGALVVQQPDGRVELTHRDGRVLHSFPFEHQVIAVHAVTPELDADLVVLRMRTYASICPTWDHFLVRVAVDGTVRWERSVDLNVWSAAPVRDAGGALLGFVHGGERAVGWLGIDGELGAQWEEGRRCGVLGGARVEGGRQLVAVGVGGDELVVLALEGDGFTVHSRRPLVDIAGPSVADFDGACVATADGLGATVVLVARPARDRVRLVAIDAASGATLDAVEQTIGSDEFHHCDSFGDARGATVLIHHGLLRALAFRDGAFTRDSLLYPAHEIQSFGTWHGRELAWSRDRGLTTFWHLRSELR